VLKIEQASGVRERPGECGVRRDVGNSLASQPNFPLATAKVLNVLFARSKSHRQLQKVFAIVVLQLQYMASVAINAT
jgi:hypothetical protein